MAHKWEQLAKEAAETTKSKLADQISSLTTLKESDINSILSKSGIQQEDFAALLKEIKNTSKSNTAKATAISNINKGVVALVEIASKLL